MFFRKVYRKGHYEYGEEDRYWRFAGRYVLVCPYPLLAEYVPLTMNVLMKSVRELNMSVAEFSVLMYYSL
jgi:hypothetical protein